LRTSKTAVELLAVLLVYFLFLAIGMYSGQTTMSVDIISPVDGMRFQSSPVELAVRVTLRGVPLPNVKARFSMVSAAADQAGTDVVTDEYGIARLLVPASSGNYTWQVTAIKSGYPTIVSRLSSFSIRLSLVVYCLLPSSSRLAISPVEFKARVTDPNGRLVESANVTFYVDSIMIGSSLTSSNGIANLSSEVTSGNHFWFASASKGGEGGVSAPTAFLVAESTESITTGDLSFWHQFPTYSRSLQLAETDLHSLSYVLTLRSPKRGVVCASA